MQQYDSMERRLLGLLPHNSPAHPRTLDALHLASSAIESLSEHMGQNCKNLHVLFRTPKFN